MTPLQNNFSKQQEALPGKLASVFQKDFTIFVLLYKKLRKAKTKASKGKKDFSKKSNADAEAEMRIPRFANGRFLFFWSYWAICVLQLFFNQVVTSKISKLI